MKIYRLLLSFLLILIFTATGMAQVFFRVDPAPDPALNHNKLLQQTADESALRQVGQFKVKGNPYLFSGHNKGDMFGKDAKAFNIFLNYNTYNQEVGFFST